MELNQDSAIRTILEGTAKETGHNFFMALVKNLSIALSTNTAWVTENLEDKKTLRTLSFYHAGEWIENHEYELKGTPCEPVINETSLVHIQDNLFELYPDDPSLKPMNAVSYMGMPFLDEQGEVLGHIAVMDNKQMPEEETALAIFRIFASRASAELQRLTAEKAIITSKEKLDRLFSSAMDAIIELDMTLNITQINPAGAEIFGCDQKNLASQSINDYLIRESRGKLIYLTKELDEKPEGKKYLWIPGGLNAINGDGQEFIAEATISATGEGNKTFYTLILRNINDRIEAEKEIDSLKLETEYLQDEIKSIHNFDEIIGNSKSIKKVFKDIENVAQTDSTVLILGETGTGKELFARAIHTRSKRSDKPLIKVNCAAIPSSLIESEFFGHEQGAFTGATKKRLGRFSLANKGTIFLDEIGDLPLDLQSKLLRVLQEGEYEPVGSSKTEKVDIRVIAATNRELNEEIEKGNFRLDLFYRLNVFPITLPPLREREEDILLLAESFVNKLAIKTGTKSIDFSDEQKLKLRNYHWPGNIRELQNIIERAVITSVNGVINLDLALPGHDQEINESENFININNSKDSKILTVKQLSEIESNNIVNALNKTNWKVSGEKGAAKLLGMPSTTLSSRMKALNIKKV